MAFEQPESGWCRYGQCPMCRLNDAVARRDGAAEDPLDAEQLETPDAAGDVENRVDRADLVEMYTLHRGGVDRRLLLGNESKRTIGALLHGRRRGRPCDDLLEVPEMPPVRLRRYVEIDFLARDLAPFHVGDPHADAVEA